MTLQNAKKAPGVVCAKLWALGSDLVIISLSMDRAESTFRTFFLSVSFAALGATVHTGAGCPLSPPPWAFLLTLHTWHGLSGAASPSQKVACLLSA